MFKMGKHVAGYHMLMILSDVDNDFDKKEGKIILKYLKENFPHSNDITNQNEILQKVKKEDYILHFNKAMDSFYEDSTESERAHFLDFAVKLVKADNKITKEENIYLNELFNAWDAQ